MSGLDNLHGPDEVLAGAAARRARRAWLLAGVGTASVRPPVVGAGSGDGGGSVAGLAGGPRWTPLLRARVQRVVSDLVGEGLVEVTDPVPFAEVGAEVGLGGCPVVYLWVDVSARVRYVGKAHRPLGAALADRAREHRRLNPAATAWVAAAGVWLAPDAVEVLGAVEQRLIRTLRPPDNTLGKPVSRRVRQLTRRRE